MGRNKNRDTGKDFSEKEEIPVTTIVHATNPPDLLVGNLTPQQQSILTSTLLPISSSENTNGTPVPKKSRRKELPIAVTVLDPTNVGLALWRARLLFDLLIGELSLMLTDIPTSAQLKKASQEEKEYIQSTIQKWKPIKAIQGVLDRIPVPVEADINPKSGLDQEEYDES